MKKVILIIRDGYGYSKKKTGNAPLLAYTPNNDHYETHYPHTLLKAHGNAVGLPSGVQGGSEVGHFTIGAGRIIFQSFERINRAIKDSSFFTNKQFLKAISHCKKHHSKLHLMGLFSDQGIHATTEHLYALLKLCKKENFKDVFIHAFLDGRDVPEKSAKTFLKGFSRRADIGKIASLVGRYYAMDRDKNYSRTKKAYDLLTSGKGIKEKDALKAIDNAYVRGDSTDYYIKPIVMTKDDRPLATIDDDDSVIFWNFRTDRARQLTFAFQKKSFDGFKTKPLKNIFFVCMTEYDDTLKANVAFPEIKIKENLGKIIAKNKLKQLRIAETEKYAHVTYFFNSQDEKPNAGEDRMMVPSPKVPSYAQKPEMSAYKVTDLLLDKIKTEKYHLIVLNYANADLVGHSGDLKATIRCCEVVDGCLGKVVDAGLIHDYTILVTADHGNAENMLYPDGSVNPSHGTNDVQFFLISDDIKPKLKKGGLSNIAPTILKIMGLKIPKEMDRPLY